MSSVEKHYLYTFVYFMHHCYSCKEYINTNLRLFILQVQVPSSVREAASQSAGKIPFTATERIKVCNESTWSFSDVFYHPKVQCEPH